MKGARTVMLLGSCLVLVIAAGLWLGLRDGETESREADEEATPTRAESGAPGETRPADGGEEEGVLSGRLTGRLVVLATGKPAPNVVVSLVGPGAAEPLATQHESSIMFMALVAVPLATTVAEHLPAVGTAWANRMDLSLAISTGSGMRLAMLLAPLMVFLSIALGEPMDLDFTQLELGALMASAMVTAFVAIDGQSNWIEGVMLLAVYVIFALAIVWWPATPLM